MSRSRNMADLLDANGDVQSGALDNVPPSNDASALTTGTLSADRIAAGSIASSKLAGLVKSDLPAKAQNYYRNHTAFSTVTLGSGSDNLHIHKINPFPNDSGVIIVGYNMLMKLDGRSGSPSDAMYPFIYKNDSTAEGTHTTTAPNGSQLTQYTGHRINNNHNGDEWTGVHATTAVAHTAGDTYSVIANADNSGSTWSINNCEMWACLISGVNT